MAFFLIGNTFSRIYEDKCCVSVGMVKSASSDNITNGNYASLFAECPSSIDIINMVGLSNLCIEKEQVIVRHYCILACELRCVSVATISFHGFNLLVVV